jgi:hypothetical protein
MIEIIRSVKVYKPSKTFRHLFIHLSLGLAMPENHHFEISKGSFRLYRGSSRAMHRGAASVSLVRLSGA